MRKLTAVLAMLLSVSVPSFGWGPEGHRIIAEVAEHHLHASTRRQILDLLGNDDLASISTWADDIKDHRPETRGWHFVDIPWNADGFSDARDCFHPDVRNPLTLADHQNCVVDRILSFESVLSEHRASPKDRLDALKFLVHFVADLHQPLHAIAEARGGNEIHISEFGSSRCGNRPCNLHMLWDIGMIEHSHRSDLEYASEIEKLINREHLQAGEGDAPADWANASFQLAHSVWLREDGIANEEYYRRNLEILDRQLALAGLRLADLLNRALGN